jgi:hypothetical protein
MGRKGAALSPPTSGRKRGREKRFLGKGFMGAIVLESLQPCPLADEFMLKNQMLAYFKRRIRCVKAGRFRYFYVAVPISALIAAKIASAPAPAGDKWIAVWMPSLPRPEHR